MEVLIWILTAVLMLVGLAGTCIPGIPGSPIILVAAVIHRIFIPDVLSWWTLGIMAALAVLAQVLEMAATVGGAKWYGATVWGILGSAVGAIVGMLMGGILTLLLGAVAGAALAELLVTKRGLAASLKAGLGAGLGLLASSAGRFVIGLWMILLFVLDCVFTKFF